MGRDAELARVAAALEAASAGAGGTVVVEGPAGIGKTRLLGAARRLAAEAGMQVLYGRGSPLEHEFAMGVVRQCFDPVVRAGPDPALFSEPAARALRVVQEVPDELPGALQEILHGLFWLVAGLAESAPVAVVIDDAHWSDDASMRFAAYLAGRLEALPVALLVGLRSNEGELEVLREIRAGANVLELGGLGSEAVARLLTVRHGAPVDAAFSGACAHASGGNPFLLEELAGALEAEGVAFTAAASDRVSEISPPAVARNVGASLARLEAPARGLAQAVAILGDDVALDLAAALAGLGDDAQPAASALVRAGLLADALPLRFRHPLLANAAHSTLPAAERAAAHARAADLLRERGAGPERIALHLLQTPPVGNPRTVGVLCEAADLARRRGAATAAIALLRRALAEPPPAGDRPELLLTLGQAEYAVGQGPLAAEHLEAAVRDAPDPVVRARAALYLFQVGQHGGEEGMRRLGRVFRETMSSVEPLDRELALRLRASALAVPGLRAGDLQAAEALAAELRDETPGEAILLSSLAFVRTWTGASAAEVAQLAERAAVQAEALIAAGALSELVAGTILALRWTDRLEAAQHLLDGAVASAQRRGSTTDYAIALSQRAAVHRRAGRLDEAEADARAALAPELDGQWWYVGHLFAALVGTLVAQGRLDEAEAQFAHVPADERTDSPSHIALILERMHLRVARGDHSGALADWAEAARRARALRGLSPAWVDDLVVAAEAHDGLGDAAAGAALRDEALALARRWDTPGALAVALRSRGELVEAIAHARRSPARLELARGLIAHGARLRRAGERSASREPLREGHELARRCGAGALAEFARGELRASGVRLQREARSGRDALTASERRIAGLAATGRANAEIARSLFLTVKTVEMHLTRAYRKLGIAGRGELPAALGET